MKRVSIICFSLLAALLLGMTAGIAESREIRTPDGAHSLRIPADMSYQAPSSSETNLKAIYLMPPDLEMLVFSYEIGQASVRELAEKLTEAGGQAEVREIAGTEFLLFQDRDDADGAPCIGYSYIEGGRMTEISFFYSTQAAMDLTRDIMESFQ